MDQKYIVEPLDAQKHNRAAFSCEVEPLNEYLQKRANADAQRGIARVHVLCEIAVPNRIIGYYTINTASIETKLLPERITKRLPRYDALPTMLIGRLAVDRQYLRQGFGEHLIIDALKRCLRLSQEIGAMAVVVDAKDERAAQFYLHYEFQRLPDKPLTLFIPMRELKF